jgi:type I restriction enzyme S subunit
MRFASYEKYRTPEIDSIDKIPSHWSEKKFRFLFTFGRGLGITKSDLVDTGIPCINYGEIHSKYGFEIVPERQELKCVVEKYLEDSPAALLNNGDFVFADTSEDLDGSGNFAHLCSNISIFAGYHTVIARPIGDDLSRFLAYFIDSSIYRSQIRKNVTGVKVFSITQNILKDSYIWLPPIEEQQKITDFLDYKTQRIDQLIERKKALIEKLEEKRIAVITQAVTKGVDKRVTFKPSCNDWLGDIPEHWKVKRLQFNIKTIKGHAFKSEYFSSSGTRVVKASDIKKKTIIDSDSFLPEVFSETHSKVVLHEGDIVISTVGSAPSVINSAVGQLGVVPESCEGALLNQNTVILKPYDKLLNEFLIFLLSATAFREHLDLHAHGTANQASLSLKDILNFTAALPPCCEQEDISIYLNKTVNKINGLISAANNTVDKLKEYRCAIITSAVTGEIDVREAVIPLGII